MMTGVRRITFRGSLIVPMALMVVIAPAVAVAANQGDDPPDSSASLANGAVDPFLLMARAADENARLEAARAALRLLAEPTPPPIPHAWLEEEPAATLRLLDGATRSQAEAEALAGALIRALRSGENGENRWSYDAVSADARAATLRVLMRSQETAACQVLVSWLEQAPPAQRQAIASALHAMTGRDDLGAVPQAWRQWLSRHQHLPPMAWRGMLAEGLHKRAERLARRERDLLARLTESTRRHYTSLPQADRAAMMAQLLADAEPAVRLLATDLFSRDLERGIPPGSEATAALSLLLEDPQAPIRQAAAVLIDRIVPEGSASRLSVALRRESEPEVATVMLRAYRRAPDPAAIDALVRWLEHGVPTYQPAMRAILALLETGFDPSDEQRQRILATIEPHNAASILPSAVHVLVRLEGDAGPGLARALLQSPQIDVRRAAADALMPFPEAIDDLLRAAWGDPAILQRAADAIARHQPWAPNLRRVAEIEINQPISEPGGQLLPITATLAAFIPIGERLAAAQQLARTPLAVRAILGEPRREQFPQGPQGDRAFARALSLLGLPMPVPPPEPEATTTDTTEAGEVPPQDPG